MASWRDGMLSWREDGLDLPFRPFWTAALILTIIFASKAGLSSVWAIVAYYLGSIIVWFVVTVLVYIIFVWLLSLTVDLDKPVTENHPIIRRIVVSIIGILCRVGRLRIHVKGWENIPKEGKFLWVGNHRSNYDPIATVWIMHHYGVPIAFITKPENMKIPLVRLIHRANYLVINRDDPRKAISTINAAAELLKNDVVNVGVYPEGTRSKGVEMLPFHNAVFKIAQKANVPMVVASVTGTENIHKNAPWQRTDVTVDFCACISPEEVKSSSTKDLGDRVRALLEDAAAQAEHA